jgi:hypothetical protein
MTAYAQLTSAQVSEHFGRCVRYGIANNILTDEQEQKLVLGYVKIAKEWIPNGNFSTQALRLEGVQLAMREIFTAQTGLDGTSGLETTEGSGRHIYKRHWLIDTAGLTKAEADTLEP